jgi:ASTRA-associated protein 1
MERIHAAIGKGSSNTATIFGPDGRGAKNSTGTKRMGSYPPKHTHEPISPRLYILGIIMSMHLLNASGGATRTADRGLSLITSYENGSVKLWQYRNVEKERSIEGLGWECLWSFMLHVESGERSGTLMCLLWLLYSDSHLRNRSNSDGNSSFTRPFYRPLGVG